MICLNYNRGIDKSMANTSAIPNIKGFSKSYFPLEKYGSGIIMNPVVLGGELAVPFYPKSALCGAEFPL